MVEHELEEVEVHGQKYEPIFKIDYDFEQYKDACMHLFITGWCLESQRSPQI